MRKHTKRFLIALALAAAGAVVVIWHGIRRPAHSDAECRALAAKLQEKQASREKDKVRIYYEFKATEMADEEAWRKAVQEVDSGIVALSNAVANCQAGR